MMVVSGSLSPRCVWSGFGIDAREVFMPRMTGAFLLERGESAELARAPA
jgi:hypothetical protein